MGEITRLLIELAIKVIEEAAKEGTKLPVKSNVKKI